MLFIPLYLGLLFIAPHLWIPPFVGMRVDLFLYPAWILWVLLKGRGRDLFAFRAPDWLFLGFIAWTGVTILVNPIHSAAMGHMIDYVKWFVMFRLVVVTVHSLRGVSFSLVLLLFFGSVLAVEGIQHMHSEEGLGWAGQSFGWMDNLAAASGVAGRTRWISIFDGPGVFCVVYTIALPVALQLSMKPFNIVVRLVAAGLTLMLLLATYYTGSRGGFLATVGVLGLFVLIRLKISLPRMIAAGSVMMLALLAAPSHLTTTSDSHGSAQHRVSMWGEGVEMAQYNPVFGIGKGNFAAYTGRLIAHNTGVEIMGESGLPGLVLWLGMLYTAYRNIFAARGGTDNPYARSFLTALALSIAGYLLSSFFVTLEYETQYFLLALAAVAGRYAPSPPTFGRRDLMIVCAIGAVFFLVTKATVMIYYS
jgi:O-antigen ligase